jgi:hypothetical protein
VKEDGLGSGAAKQAVSLIFSHGMRHKMALEIGRLPVYSSPLPIREDGYKSIKTIYGVP